MKPKRVYPEELPLYSKMLTKKIEMISGTEITALHLLKETKQYYISISSWAYNVSTLKRKKKNIPEFKINFPILENKDAKDFLATHAWNDWVNKELNVNNKDMKIVIDFLNKLFPDKEKIYFDELDSIISAYCFGNFLSYKDNDEIKPPTAYDIKSRKYYTRKYYGVIREDEWVYPEKLISLQKKYKDAKTEEERKKAFNILNENETEFYYKEHNLTDVFVELGQHIVVCPYIFPTPSVENSTYEHAGEISFIVTDDKIYFEYSKHF